MNLIRIGIAVLLLSTASIAQAQSNTPGRPVAVTAYEQCAVRVLSYSNDLNDIFDACKAEMDAHTEYLNDEITEQIEQQMKAESQRELQARKNTRNEQE